MFQRLKEKYRFDKANMNYVRFKFNYVYFPLLCLVALLDLIVCFLLLTTNSSYKVVSVSVTLVVLLICLVLYILLLNLIKNKEIKIESEKLKLFFSSELLENPENEYFLPRVDEENFVKLIFTGDGIQIDDFKYSYKGFECALYTSNFLHQVSLIIMFSRTDIGDKEDGEDLGVSQFSLPLNINLLSVMNKYKIKIKNTDVLKFIKENPESASKQILSYGKIQDNYYKFK